VNPALARGLDFAADCYGPALALLAILAPWISGNDGQRVTFRYYVAAGAGVLFVYLIKALDDRLGLWNHFHLDYSTHSAFAASLVVSLAILRPRWIVPLTVSLICYGTIVLLLFHSAGDILSAAALLASITAVLHWLLGTRRDPRIG
jgi:hypothetical protein